MRAHPESVPDERARAQDLAAPAVRVRVRGRVRVRVRVREMEGWDPVQVSLRPQCRVEGCGFESRCGHEVTSTL